jgi:putative colanic acid biosynthesis UDP-glucose lipid carrier transferase
MFRLTSSLINDLITATQAATLFLLALAITPAAAALGVQQPPGFVIALTLMEIGIFVVVQRSVTAYPLDSYLRLDDSITWAIVGLMLAWTAGALATIVARPFTTTTLVWFAVTHVPQLMAIIGLRVGARFLARHVGQAGLVRRNTLVIGDGPLAERAIKNLTAPGSRDEFHIVGVVSEAACAPAGQFSGHSLLGGLSVLPEVAARELIDLVVIATPAAGTDDLADAFGGLQYFGADVVLIMSEAFSQVYHGPRHDIAGMSVLSLAERPLKGWQSVLKLIFDKVVAAVALLLLAPLMLLIGVLIRLQSPGPALFRQERVGLNHQIFRIYKFRTMTVDLTDDGTIGTTGRGDQRITRIGRFLRASSLDELPQLLNVLLGDMSIVGPRPYVAKMRVQDEIFDRLSRNFAARHRVKPGITGLAQANGFRSHALRNKDTASQSVKLDLEYIANWSVWLDIQLIIRTVLLAMSGPEVF